MPTRSDQKPKVSTDTLKEIEDAYRSFFKAAPEARMHEMIQSVSQIQPSYETYAGFKALGKASTKKEIELLRKQLKNLINRLEGLHKTSIDVLKYVGFYDDRSSITIQCSNIMRAIEKADFSKIPVMPKARKPTKDVADGTVRILITHVEELRGKFPTLITRDGVACGPFLKFVTAIFKALEINASPEAAIRRGLPHMKKTRKEHPPSWSLTHPLKGD